jgi:hypothetical protein
MVLICSQRLYPLMYRLNFWLAFQVMHQKSCFAVLCVALVKSVITSFVA